MVTRKPLPNGSDNNMAPSHHAAPYPTTPIEPAAGSHEFPSKSDPKLTRKDSDGSIGSTGTWDDSDEEDGYVEVPQPLKIRPSSQDMHGQGQKQEDGLPAALRPGGGVTMQAELPSILRPGPVGGSMESVNGNGNPWATAETSKNPYKQKSAEDLPVENSQNVWQHEAAHVLPPTQPSQAPPPPPLEDMSRMSLHDGPTGSYETAEVLKVPHKGMPPFSPVVPQSTGHSAQSSAFPSSNPWSGSEGHAAPSPGLPPKHPVENVQQQQAFRPPYPTEPDFAPDTHQQHQSPSGPPPVEPTPQYQPPSGPPPARFQQPQHQPPPGYQPPPGPPLASLIDHQDTPSTPTALPPMQHDEATRNELYQVKHIRWWDAASNSMRSSPILTQNANGPCPLLALVNAIVLSTPANLNTPLVDALSDNGNRSQISLGFLLDALFDELTSRRRGEVLPDVTELYAFLLALHTGMNVNPRFITPTITPRGSLDGHSSANNNIYPTNRSQSKAGAFEETKEMQLYSTLNIPLIHGWIPPPSTPAYDAFYRSAQTFEEAQNIQFLEQDYLALPHLDAGQQQMLDDIRTIKQFLSNWPTQLTEYGLEAISTSLQPGQVAILFRNDHFSTLYREPKGGALMTLVTDTGYTSHEEIVWESLVDVNGAAAEMVSGDFRTVSHSQQAGMSDEAAGIAQWQQAQSRHSGQASGVVDANGREAEIAPPLPGPRPTPQESTAGNTVQTDHELAIAMSSSEQADHDFALALQMQEEEEDEQRQADARRAREQELSERFLSSQETPPAIPPRRGSGRRQSGTIAARAGRPAVTRPAETAAAGEAPPPSYEESRTDRVLRPGERPPLQGQSGSPQQQSGGSPQQPVRTNWNGHGGNQNQPIPAGRGRGGPSRGGRGGGNGGAANVKDAEDKCVMM